MESSKPAPILFFIFLALLFIRPFISSLAYPHFEPFYQNLLILLAILTFLKAPAVPHSPLLLPITLLLVSYVFSTPFSLNLKNSLRETYKFISYIATFIFVLNTNEKQKKILIKTIIISALLISLYAIYQYFWGYENTISFLKKTNPEFLNTSQYARDILIAKRSIGTFPSPTLFGGYLILIFFLPFALISSNSPKFSKLIPIFLITFALILTKSLGAWLSLIFGLIIFLTLIHPHLKQISPDYSKKKLNLILIFIFIFICLILAFILINRWERLMDLQNPQNSITQRLNYWRTTLAIIKDHPFFGVGPGNFHLAYPKYKIGLSTDTRYAHNLLLHLWSENGLLGLVSILLLIFIFLKNSKKDTPIYAAIFAGILTFLFHNLIDNAYLIPEVGLFWWVLLGL